MIRLFLVITPISFSPFHLICVTPNNTIIFPEDRIDVDISLNNGVTFISSNVTMVSSQCVSAFSWLLSKWVIDYTIYLEESLFSRVETDARR